MTPIKLVGFFVIALISCCAMAANAAKPYLVLLPIDVSEQDSELESEYGSALQEGLQKRYTVFYGAAVEKELEKEYGKINCDAETCNQNVAIAFNGELIADGSVKSIKGGYLLKLVVRNVLTSEVIETQSVPCRGCDSFSVIDQLISMGNGTRKNGKTKISGSSSNVIAANSGQRAILIFDSQPSGASISLNGKIIGKTPYQGLNHKIGDKLKLSIKQTNYRSYDLTLDLQQPITQLEPLALELGQGQVLIASDPFKANSIVYVNGQAKGTAPLTLTLSAGEYSIQIKTKNESTKTKLILVKSDKQDQHLLIFNSTLNKAIPLKKNIDIMSYGIGLGMAKSVKGQKVKVSLKTLVLAVKNTLSGAKAIFEENDIRDAFTYIRKHNANNTLSEGSEDLYQSNLDKMSYGIGRSMARSMTNQPIAINNDAALAGLKDGLYDKAPRVEQGVIDTAITALKEDRLANEDKDSVARIISNEKFLLENSNKNGVITTQSGLQYKVLTRGLGGLPKETDIVEVHYHGTTIDGTVFDSSVKRGKSAKFPLNKVIAGWTEVLLLMQAGSKFRVYIPSGLAYGDTSPTPKIPVNSVLIFDIELLSIVRS